MEIFDDTATYLKKNRKQRAQEIMIGVRIVVDGTAETIF